MLHGTRKETLRKRNVFRGRRSKRATLVDQEEEVIAMPAISELTFITFHTLYYNLALPTGWIIAFTFDIPCLPPCWTVTYIVIRHIIVTYVLYDDRAVAKLRSFHKKIVSTKIAGTRI